jgi:hypothetical protein
MWGALSDERTGLSFTFAADSRQRSRFRVRGGLRWRYSTSPSHRLGSIQSHNHIVTDDQSISKSFMTRYLRSSFCGAPCLTRGRLLAIEPWHVPHNKHRVQRFICCRLRIRFHGSVLTAPLHSNGRIGNTASSFVACLFAASDTCLPCRFLSMGVFIRFTIPAFSRPATK